MAAQPHFPWRPLGQLLVEQGLLEESQLEAALGEQGRSGRRLGEILLGQGLLSGAELLQALAAQHGLEVEFDPDEELQLRPAPAADKPWRPLGRLLVESGRVSQADLDEAVTEQRRNGRRLGEILVERGRITPSDLTAALAEQHGVDLASAPEAFDARVAVGHLSQEAYEVRKSRSGAPLFASPSFLDAADFAFEYLEDGAPEELEIVRVRGHEQETVWSYSEQRAAEAEETKQDTVQRYGFDASAWQGPPAYSPTDRS
jgi:hypothetical protein